MSVQMGQQEETGFNKERQVKVQHEQQIQAYSSQNNELMGLLEIEKAKNINKSVNS